MGLKVHTNSKTTHGTDELRLPVLWNLVSCDFPVSKVLASRFTVCMKNFRADLNLQAINLKFLKIVGHIVF